MSHRFIAAVGVLGGIVAMVSLSMVLVAGQAPTTTAERTAAVRAWTPPRTPDGQPDVQGVWNYATITPLERPADLGGKPVFSDEEAAGFEKQTNERRNQDRRDGGAEADLARAYNHVWWDFGSKIVGTKQTSLVVDPPDGRIPPLTPEGQKRVEALAARARRYDSWEDRPLAERCLSWATAGPPMLPSAYNNNVQLFQTPGHVVILNEMIHEHRFVPLDGRPHGTLRQWMGDSRGRWEGNTLVVDTINFTSKTSFRGSSENMHLVERFTRIDPDTLLYEFTVDDPTTFTRPWTAQIPMTRSQDKIYEYACHEGNYGLFNVLEGARVQEKAAAKKK